MREDKSKSIGSIVYQIPACYLGSVAVSSLGQGGDSWSCSGVAIIYPATRAPLLSADAYLRLYRR
jgi:hypothetical protein